MKGLVGQKIGMTRIFDESGKVIPVTVIKAGPCFAVQKRTEEKDGYVAMQVAYGIRKKVNNPIAGHLKKYAQNGNAPKVIREIRDFDADIKEGEPIPVTIFKPGDSVDIQGVTKGKGFASLMKRHNFRGGPASHGHTSHRRAGSIGAGSSPGRVIKGLKMAGRMGGKVCSSINLKVVEVDEENNLILVKGAVPGARNGYVIIKDSYKQQ